MRKKLAVFVFILLLAGGAFWLSDNELLTGAVKKISLKKSAPQKKEEKVKAKKKSLEEEKKPQDFLVPKLPLIPVSVEVPKAIEFVAPQVSTLETFIQFQKQAVEDASAQRKQMIDLLTQILTTLKNPTTAPSTIIYQSAPAPPSPSAAPAGPSPAPPAEPSPLPLELPDPIAYWNFDEASGDTAIDSGIYQYHGGLVSKPTRVLGRIGNALSFTGVEYVDLGTSESLSLTDQFTVEAWFKTNSTGTNEAIYKRSGNYGTVLSKDEAGRISFGFISDNNGSPKLSIATSPKSYSDGSWHHAVGTYGDQFVRLYIDGSEAAKKQSNDIPYYQTQRSAIGRNANEGGWVWKGEIDEVKIYDKTLTAEQVKKLYDEAQKIANPSSLLAYYSFDDEENIAQDASGSGNTGVGVVIGSPQVVDGRKGKALEFDGKSAIEINLPQVNMAVETKVTAAFWMNWSGRVDVMPFGFQQYDVYFAPTTPVSFGFNTGVGDMFGIAEDKLARKWVHMVAEFTNGDLGLNKLYLDGVEQPLGAKSENIGRGSVTANAYIGGWGASENYKFTGKIDEVKIYNRALTLEEIQADYRK